MILADTLSKGFIRGYQLFLSPILPGTCRYQPTCSQYAIEAIGRFGTVHGLWLALKRLGRCHPWSGFGYDPIPESETDGGKKPCCHNSH